MKRRTYTPTENVVQNWADRYKLKYIPDDSPSVALLELSDLVNNDDVMNGFCATGHGGGNDNSCGVKTGGGKSADAAKSGSPASSDKNKPAPKVGKKEDSKPTDSGAQHVSDIKSAEGSTSQKMAARLGKLGAGAKAAEHIATEFVKDGVNKTLAKLPGPLRIAAEKTIALGALGTKVAFAGWSASSALAERVAKERGMSPEQAKSLRGTLAGIDMVATKPLLLASHALLGPLSIVPPATGAYLAYSTARNPLATARAAAGLVSDSVKSLASKIKGKIKGKKAENQFVFNADANDPDTKLLIDVLEAHDFDDWFIALFLTALDKTEDVPQALKIAAQLYQDNPTDPSEADDGGEDLLQAPDDAVKNMDASCDDLDDVDDLRQQLFDDGYDEDGVEDIIGDLEESCVNNGKDDAVQNMDEEEAQEACIRATLMGGDASDDEIEAALEALDGSDWDSDYADSIDEDCFPENAYCATGVGGGQDNSCGRGGGDKSETSLDFETVSKSQAAAGVKHLAEAAVQSGEVDVWHGTSDAALKDIAKHGLMPHAGIGADKAVPEMGDRFEKADVAFPDRKESVYFTSKKMNAVMFGAFAQKAVYEQTGKLTEPVVLHIKLPASEVKAHVKTDELFEPDGKGGAGVNAFRHIGTIKPEWIAGYSIVRANPYTGTPILMEEHKLPTVNAAGESHDVYVVLLAEPTKGEVENAFCPTGTGGGQDNSCGSGHAVSAELPRGAIIKLAREKGFSFVVGQKKYQKTGAEGYAVSVYPERGAVFSKRVFRKQIRDFMDKNADLLKQPDHAVGAWRERSTGKTYLDVSVVTHDRDHAIELGKKHNQIAIYDFKNGTTIDTGGDGKNPENEANNTPLSQNEFCKTGVGGGVDPSCGRDGEHGQSGSQTTDRSGVHGSALPLREDGRVELTHWSHVQGIESLDPAKFGGGPIGGAERRRQQNDPLNFVPRTYYGVGVGSAGGYEKESGLGPHRYTASLHPSKLYDFENDPKHLENTALPVSDRATMYEKSIRDAGYDGYFRNHPQLGSVAAVFAPLKVEKTVVDNAFHSTGSGGGTENAKYTFKSANCPKCGTPAVDEGDPDNGKCNRCGYMWGTPTENEFCPTGPGGGVDPSCSPKKSGGAAAAESGHRAFGRDVQPGDRVRGLEKGKRVPITKVVPQSDGKLELHFGVGGGPHSTFDAHHTVDPNELLAARGLSIKAGNAPLTRAPKHVSDLRAGDVIVNPRGQEHKVAKVEKTEGGRVNIEYEGVKFKLAAQRAGHPLFSAGVAKVKLAGGGEHVVTQPKAPSPKVSSLASPSVPAVPIVPKPPPGGKASVKGLLRAFDPALAKRYNKISHELVAANKVLKAGNDPGGLIAKRADEIRGEMAKIRADARERFGDQKQIPQDVIRPRGVKAPKADVPNKPSAPKESLKPEQARLLTLDKTPEQSRLAVSDESKRESLGEKGINGSYKVTLANGAVGAWKPHDEEPDRKVRDAIPPRTSYLREAAAYDVAKAVGVHDLVPPTVVREIGGKIGSMQEFQEGAKVALKTLVDNPYYGKGPGPDTFDGEKDLARAAAFDTLIGSTDRHMKNWMIKDDGNGSPKLRLIDNGLAFPEKAGGWGNFQIAQRARNVGLKVPKEVENWDGKKIIAAMKPYNLGAKAENFVKARLKELKKLAAEGGLIPEPKGYN